MVNYKDKRYVTMIDQNLGTHFELPHLTYFWMDYQNIKSLVRDALLYREHLLSTDAVTEPFHFFKFYTQDNLNHVIGRRTPPGVEKKLSKLDKKKIRMSRQLEAGNFELVYHYTKCMQKVIEHIPALSKGIDHYQSSAKFAWFIELDSLEVFTQSQLIPNGFIL